MKLIYFFFFDEYDEYDTPMWYNTTYIEGTAYVYENKEGNRGIVGYD